MEVKFDTEVFSPLEAKGLVAMLYCLFGQEVLPNDTRVEYSQEPQVSVTHRIGEIEQTITAPTPDIYAAVAAQVLPPVEPTEEPEGPASTATVDASGTPWDARIHSGGKSLMKDGNWTKKRGVSDEVYAQVMAELKGAPVAPPPPVAPVAPPPVAETPVAPPPPAAEAFAAPVPPVAPPAAPAGGLTFIQVMSEVTKLQTEGRVTPEKLNASLAAFGMTTLAGLTTATDETRAGFVAMLGA